MYDTAFSQQTLRILVSTLHHSPPPIYQPTLSIPLHICYLNGFHCPMAVLGYRYIEGKDRNMVPQAGQLVETHKSGFLGMVAEVIMESKSLYRVRLVNDFGVEKWTMVQV